MGWVGCEALEGCCAGCWRWVEDIQRRGVKLGLEETWAEVEPGCGWFWVGRRPLHGGVGWAKGLAAQELGLAGRAGRPLHLPSAAAGSHSLTTPSSRPHRLRSPPTCHTTRPSPIRPPPIPGLQLGSLPPDSLLLAYAYVAIMFGRAFASPDELGGSATAVTKVPSLIALGAADFAVSPIGYLFAAPGLFPCAAGWCRGWRGAGLHSWATECLTVASVRPLAPTAALCPASGAVQFPLELSLRFFPKDHLRAATSCRSLRPN